MGVYIEYNFGLTIKNLPPNVLKILISMADGYKKSDILQPWPDHPLFTIGNRWDMIFRKGSHSLSGSYLPGATLTQIKNEYEEDPRDEYILTVWSSCKIYYNELSLFFDWIKPYIDQPHSCFIGSLWYDPIGSKVQKVHMPRLLYLDKDNNILTFLPDRIIQEVNSI